MAKREPKAKKQYTALDILREKFLPHVEELWITHQESFSNAIEDSEKKRLNLTFTATVDLSESEPILTSTIAWKDKTVEDGCNVTKTIKSQVLRTKGDDPSQEKLPLE